MNSHQIFKIDENHFGIEVDKIYSKDYRFPIEMIVKGEKYGDIESTLNKPHGKKMIIDFIYKLLLKGPKTYKSLVKQAPRNFTWFDLNDTLEILLLDGIIEVVFKNQKPKKGTDWMPKKIQLDSRISKMLLERLPDYESEFIKLEKLVMDLIADVKGEFRGVILQWISDKEIRDQSGNLIAVFKYFKRYKSIILIATYYIKLKEERRKLPLRHLSNQIWNNPKILNNYKKESADVIGIDIDEFDAVLLPDINGDLYKSLILISPLEELQKLISRIQLDRISFFIDDIDCCVQKVISILENPSNSEFLLNYDILKKEVRNINSLETLEVSLRDFNKSIKDLKKEDFKISCVRQQFELIVLEEIGSGSFARVYKVFDPELNEIVACKILFPRTYFKQVYGNDGEEYILRFKREVRLLTEELFHKNIINVIKVKLDESFFWFTMPLANFSLEEWIKNNKDATLKKRIIIFNEIILGVKYLHEKNKFHRDLSPNNILMFEKNNKIEVKIADFGLAKDPESISFFTGLSKKGYGQENFTDPEQLDNLADSNNMSDIYSLGALLYYLISSKLPKKRFYVPVFCQDVVLKAMDKRRQRYQNIYEFENDLNECIKKHDIN